MQSCPYTPQHHPGLSLGLGGDWANSIKHDIKRDDIWFPGRVSFVLLLLWNISFDNILKEDIPPGVGIICWEMILWWLQQRMIFPSSSGSKHYPWGCMTHWIQSVRLSLATTKMEVVLFKCRCWSSRSSFRLKGKKIRLCTALKYLGLRFDGKLTFKEHAEWVADNAERIVMSISQLMSNLGGLSKGKCKLLVNVPTLILCGAPIWTDAINAKEYRRKKWFRSNGNLQL